MIQTLQNNILRVEIDTKGAEIQSIKNLRTNQEYIWQGDARFWSRRSPVLFPIVGSVWNAHFRMDGKEYPMGQHGFARDREFDIVNDTPDDEAWFALESDDETLAAYPRRFRLEIGYHLIGERLTVMWRVINRDDKEMAFQIGAHPAFYYPDFNPKDEVHGYFQFGGKNLETRLLGEKGTVTDRTMPVVLDGDDMLPLTGETFSIDTIILEKGVVRRVSFLDKERKPYLSVFFNAPVVGMWSPAPDCPFVCIEPWWGRCDRQGFEGEFKERDYVNSLAPGEIFDAQYMIAFENI